MRPETRYARSGDVGIAYLVGGEGEIDLVVAFPYISHLDLLWEIPAQSPEITPPWGSAVDSTPTSGPNVRPVLAAGRRGWPVAPPPSKA